MSYRKAREAVKRRDYKHALALLKPLLAAKQRDGKVHALAGLAHFKLQEYAEAAREYQKAVKVGGPKRELRDWDEMRALAEANATAEIDVPVPKPYYFKRTALLAPPSVRDGDLPTPPRHPPGPGCCKRLRLCLGDALGAALTVFMNWLIDLVGEKFGYRGKVWTNWYRRCVIVAVLLLAYMREQLNTHNLKSTYPAGALVGFQARGQRAPVGVSHFRTADGSWNNLADPKEGAAGTRFLRNVKLSAAVPEKGRRLLTPNPREVSIELLRRPERADGQPDMVPVKFLNLLAASWIQFMVHDWINHGEVSDDKFIRVPLPGDDPARDRYLQTELAIGTSQPDPTRNDAADPADTSFINEVTHWWDGSQIYGSDQETQNRLRSHQFGKMELSDDGGLPVETSTYVDPGTGVKRSSRVEDSGFRRNWWIGLTMLHNLFVREHNAICDMLHEAYPAWGDDDNRLFNVARLINAAVMAKIHSIEWTPAILPNEALETGLNSNWYGLFTYLLQKGKARKTLSEVNIRNAELGGIVGNPINQHGCAFGFSEEFVEVYRLHSLLPEKLELQKRGKAGITPVSLTQTRQHGSVVLTDNYAMSDLFYSFGNQQPGALVLNNYPRFMQELSVPGNVFLDMGTVDILRARERGVPRYNKFRRLVGLNPIERFDDLTDNAHVLNKLRSVYGGPPDNVEDLDLMVGTLAEGQRPNGFGFGETLFQIFIVNASRRLQADRFYTDCYNEEVYTPEGLRWIDQTDLKTAILRHYPELADTGLANIKNAFEPWDEGPELDPDRHPLRAWDRELKPDPWRGDAYRHT
jgi:hypothetical protein